MGRSSLTWPTPYRALKVTPVQLLLQLLDPANQALYNSLFVAVPVLRSNILDGLQGCHQHLMTD